MKPLSQQEIMEMVRAGKADDAGAKMIEQRGVNFGPTQKFLQTVEAAGVSDAFLRALK